MAKEGKNSKVRVTVDGKTVDVARGTTILKAAREVGVEIPTLCYHPKLSIIGACRLCLVEVEGLHKLVASCLTPVGEGMIIKTDTPRVKEVRQTMLELLLARHPQDCLVCDKGGDCELQKMTYLFGPSKNRFTLEKREYVIEDVSPFIERDVEKCIMCRRCIRVCRDVRGVTVLGAMYRGYKKTIGTFFEEPLNRDFQDPYNCEFCGSCVDICPVGALTAKPSKYVSRPWEEERRETSCPFCGVGCRAKAYYRDNLLIKTTPLKTEEGSLTDLCFRGRFGTGYVNHPERLKSWMIRKGGSLDAVGEKEGLERLVELLKKNTPGPVTAFIGTETAEGEGYILAEVLGRLSASPEMVALDSRGDPENLLTGIYDQERMVPVDDLATAKRIVVVGQDFTFMHPVASIRLRQAVAGGAELLLIDPLDTLLGKYASWWIRTPTPWYGYLLKALAEHGKSHKTGKIQGIITKTGGLSPERSKEMIRWLKDSGPTTVVLQKIPGGIHGAVQAALWSMASSFFGDEWSHCYIPLDTDGLGLPLMIAAAGFREAPDAFKRLVRGELSWPAIFFRSDPLGSSWQRAEWQAFRSKSPLWVSFASNLTETSRASDVVIPLPTYVEIEDTSMTAGGPRKFAALYEPPAGVFTMEETVSRLAEALGIAWDKPDRPFDAEKMRYRGYTALAGFPAARAPGEGISPAVAGTGEREFILSMRWHRFPGHRLELVGARALLGPEACLEINPIDAAALALEDGREISFSLEGKRFSWPVKLTPRVPRSQLCLPFDPSFEGIFDFIDHARSRGRDGWGGMMIKLDKE